MGCAFNEKDGNKVYYVNIRTMPRNPHIVWGLKKGSNPLNPPPGLVMISTKNKIIED